MDLTPRNVRILLGMITFGIVLNWGIQNIHNLGSFMDGLGIERDWLNRYPSELSGGELQRFCIARALGEKTRFLLADEITTMLDLITQSQIWHFLLEEIKGREIGLLVVSHSGPLLDQICTRKVDMDQWM